MPHLSINKHKKIYYEDHGKGDPILLIAGLNCDSRIWTLVLEDLKKNFRVISFDNRGVGQSADIDSPWTIEYMAKDAFKLLDHLDIQQVTVIGHSMGGAIAQMMAYLAPLRIQKLVICNSLIKVNTFNRLLCSLFILIRFFGLNPRNLMQRAVPLLFSKAFRKDQTKMAEIAKAFLERRNHPQVFINYRRQLDALLQFNSSKWLEQIQSPTLVIEGSEDRLCPRDPKILAKKILKSKLISMKNVGHVPMLEQPHQFVQILTHFLQSQEFSGRH